MRRLSILAAASLALAACRAPPTRNTALAPCSRLLAPGAEPPPSALPARPGLADEVARAVSELVSSGQLASRGLTLRQSAAVVIEVAPDQPACSIASQLVGRFPDQPVYVRVWPPPELATEGKDFFGVWRLDDGSGRFIQLSEHGTALVEDHCNQSYGRWHTLGSARIGFTNMATTAKGCLGRADDLAPPIAGSDAADTLTVELADGRRVRYLRA